MDHSHHMEHAASSHGAHGGGDMGEMCNMNMLFTWDSTNLCIVFRQWHIRSTASLVVSLVAVVVLAMGYEALRSVSRRYETTVNKRIAALPHEQSEDVTETTPFLATGQYQVAAGRNSHVVKAVLYALQNFYAFMLMLVFMTYNGWVMIAVSLGALFGYLLFGQSTSSTKDNACH
ncbi:hypothetical protein DCS_03827 [Drechmeria coniospora]|uniref:Copper transport protein n=1 Tax=Drechmeria coniospora TaxID=98403 RepID=A0A151GIE7_DRECN|nr:hypothetical protein DCS_03827 [Drechmeria coniospora]KYK56821.1 hypothetical protein DCS_03827 [Drechmeria coniospora]